MTRTWLPALAALCFTTNASAEDRDTVWVWFTRCVRPKSVMLEVRLDTKLIYQTSFLMCRAERRMEPKTQLTFSFDAPRPIVWVGYRSDEGDTTAASTRFKVSFWQAGGDPDALLLGATSNAADGLHMNTILTVRPGKTSEEELAQGLTVKTFPRSTR